MKLESGKILLINGPNMNMLGYRESSIYGTIALEEIERKVKEESNKKGYDILSFQSNIEGEICDFIHNNTDCIGIIINAAAYAHTSIAILDALNIVKNINSDIIIVEVHLSNIAKRESFREKSYISIAADAIISGMKDKGYLYALNFILDYHA